jgi:hypothetical protein
VRAVDEQIRRANVSDAGFLIGEGIAYAVSRRLL